MAGEDKDTIAPTADPSTKKVVDSGNQTAKYTMIGGIATALIGGIVTIVVAFKPPAGGAPAVAAAAVAAGPAHDEPATYVYPPKLDGESVFGPVVDKRLKIDIAVRDSPFGGTETGRLVAQTDVKLFGSIANGHAPDAGEHRVWYHVGYSNGATLQYGWISGLAFGE